MKSLTSTQNKKEEEESKPIVPEVVILTLWAIGILVFIGMCLLWLFTLLKIFQEQVLGL